ncbi:thioredoxin family protein [Elizabethkingia meningoseptica]|uniref:thioredoxin family protein n=1 Tax=Elizabethkingia meningoseptica TaxID=238 RepID=UPI002011567F|nr:thioredoxin family protein [Elizabethkingia meningoseptica]MCL1675834.1 thioredoxin family protein [Elizabethkingia meningoseptica]MCL1687698.1 thioredoxin family protein [Elizabethkingia meningoseptica]
MRKKIIIFFLFIFFSQYSYSQLWVNDIGKALKLAKATNKLILIDFNASWCEPCRKMQAEYLNNPDYKKTLDKFVLVSVDIDDNRGLASNYGIKSIPNIFIIDVNGNSIFNVAGYMGAENLDNDLSGFPATTRDLYDALVFTNPKKPTDEELLSLGSSYQALLQLSKSSVAKESFKKLSNDCFIKGKKNSQNKSFIERAHISIIYNDVLLNKTKKAFNNLEVDKVSAENQSFAYYVLAQAYFIDGKREEALRAIEEINKQGKEEWLANANLLRKKYEK